MKSFNSYIYKIFKKHINYSYVLAKTVEGGIGKNNDLPWHIPTDMKFFNCVTSIVDNKTKILEQNYIDSHNLNKFKIDTNTCNNKKKLINCVIMGKNTYYSIPKKYRPLNNRFNIILSKNKIFKEEIEKLNNKYIKVFEDFDLCIDFVEKMSDINYYDNNNYNMCFNEVFIIGGKQIYDLFSLNKEFVNNKLTSIIVTQITKNIDSDTFVTLPDNFKTINVSKTLVENDISYDFRIMINNKLLNNSHKNSIIYNINHTALNFYPKHEEYQYLNLVREIIEKGNYKNDRTGIGTLSLFGRIMRFDCSKTFPLLTTKDTYWKGIVEELLWFIKGSTNVKHLQEKKVKIWDGNSTRQFLDSIGLNNREEGDLGPVYGFQWRHFGAEYKTMHEDYTNEGVDQLQKVIDSITNNPNSRRIIMSAWNVKDLAKMALPPCHVMCQFYVHEKVVSLQMYQRSCDIGLGIPFNIASYCLLLNIICHITNTIPGEFIHVLGDAHVYKNHVEELKKQLTRDPYAFPTLKIKRKVTNINDFTFKDFELINYKHHPKIKMNMAV